MYEYLKLYYDPVTLEYEPSHYSNEDYTPDFVISTNFIHFAFEVKPVIEKGNWSKYIKFMKSFTNIQRFYLITPKGYEVYLPISEKIKNGKLDKMKYFQAINNVKEYIER